MRRSQRDLNLFEPDATVPDGFVYRPDFLSEIEEHGIVAELLKLPLTPFKYYQFTGKRRTASFGWEYEFGERDIRPAAEIPSFLLPLRARAGTLFDIAPEELRQVSVIEYSPGAPIGWHRDIPQFGVVLGISLAGPCRMRFRKFSRGRAKTSREVLAIELQPRSIYLMSGASRQSWQHSIPPVKELRYAIMMRTLRN